MKVVRPSCASLALPYKMVGGTNVRLAEPPAAPLSGSMVSARWFMFGARIKIRSHAAGGKGTPEQLLVPFLHLLLLYRALGFLVSQSVYCPNSLPPSLELLILACGPFLHWLWWTPLGSLFLPVACLYLDCPKLAAQTGNLQNGSLLSPLLCRKNESRRLKSLNG